MKSWTLRSYASIVVGLSAAALQAPAIAQGDQQDPLPQVAEHMAVVKAAQEAAFGNARNEAERRLMKADLDFAADAQRMHVAEAFGRRVVADAVLIGQDEPIVFGAEAIVADMRRSKASWYWSPLAARVNGDLGVTWGVAAIVYRNKEGRQASVQTRYVTAWRLQNNEWKIWLDTGTTGPATMATVQSASTSVANSKR